MSDERLYLYFGTYSTRDPLCLTISSTCEDKKKGPFLSQAYITNDQLKVAEALRTGNTKAFLFPEMKEITEVDIILK